MRNNFYKYIIFLIILLFLNKTFVFLNAKEQQVGFLSAILNFFLFKICDLFNISTNLFFFLFSIFLFLFFIKKYLKIFFIGILKNLKIKYQNNKKKKICRQNDKLFRGRQNLFISSFREYLLIKKKNLNLSKTDYAVVSKNKTKLVLEYINNLNSNIDQQGKQKNLSFFFLLKNVDLLKTKININTSLINFFENDSYLIKKRRKKYYSLLLIHFLIFKLQRKELVESLNLDKKVGNYPFTMAYDEEIINFRRSKYFDYSSTELFFLLSYGLLEWILMFYSFHLGLCAFCDFNIFDIIFKTFENFLPIHFKAYSGYIKISLLLNSIFFFFFFVYNLTDWVKELTDEVSTYQLPPKDLFVDIFLPALQGFLLIFFFAIFLYLYFYKGGFLILFLLETPFSYLYNFTFGFFINIENLIFLFSIFDINVFLKLFLLPRSGILSAFYGPFFSNNTILYNNLYNNFAYTNNIPFFENINSIKTQNHDFYFFFPEYENFLELKMWKNELLFDIRKYNYFLKQENEIYMAKHFINRGFRGLGLRLDNQYFLNHIDLILNNSVRHFRPNAEHLVDPIISNKFFNEDLKFINFSTYPNEKNLKVKDIYLDFEDDGYVYSEEDAGVTVKTIGKSKFQHNEKTFFHFFKNLFLKNFITIYPKTYNSSCYDLDINNFLNYQILSKFIYSDISVENLNYTTSNLNLNKIRLNNYNILKNGLFFSWDVYLDEEPDFLNLNLNLLNLNSNDVPFIDSLFALREYLYKTITLGEMFEKKQKRFYYLTKKKKNFNFEQKEFENLLIKENFSIDFYNYLKRIILNENDIYTLILNNLKLLYAKNLLPHNKHHYDEEIEISNNLLKNYFENKNEFLNSESLKIKLNHEYVYPFLNIFFKPFYYVKNTDNLQLFSRLDTTNDSRYRMHSTSDSEEYHAWNIFFFLRNRLFKVYANFPSIFSFYNRKNIIYLFNLNEKFKFLNKKNEIIKDYNFNEINEYYFSSYYNMEIKIQNFAFFQNTLWDRYFHKYFDTTYITQNNEVTLYSYNNNFKNKLIFLQPKFLPRFAQTIFSQDWKISKNIWLEYPNQDYIEPFIQYRTHLLNNAKYYRLETNHSQLILDYDNYDFSLGLRRPTFSKKYSNEYNHFPKKKYTRRRKIGFLFNRELLRNYHFNDYFGILLLKDYQNVLNYDKKNFLLNEYLYNLVNTKFLNIETVYKQKLKNCHNVILQNNKFNNNNNQEFNNFLVFYNKFLVDNLFLPYTLTIRNFAYNSFFISYQELIKNKIKIDKLNASVIQKNKYLKHFKEIEVNHFFFPNYFNFIFLKNNNDFSLKKNVNVMYVNSFKVEKLKNFQIFIPYLYNNDILNLKYLLNNSLIIPKQQEIIGVFDRLNIRLMNFIERFFYKNDNYYFYKNYDYYDYNNNIERFFGKNVYDFHKYEYDYNTNISLINLKSFLKLRGNDLWNTYSLNSNYYIYDNLIDNIQLHANRKRKYHRKFQSSKTSLLKLEQITYTIVPYRLNYSINGFTVLQKDISNQNFYKIIKFYLDDKNFIDFNNKIIKKKLEKQLSLQIIDDYKKKYFNDFFYSLVSDDYQPKNVSEYPRFNNVNLKVFLGVNSNHFLFKSDLFRFLFFELRINPYLYGMFSFPYNNQYTKIWNKSLHSNFIVNQILSKMHNDRIFGLEVINNNFRYKKIYFLRSFKILEKLMDDDLIFVENFEKIYEKFLIKKKYDFRTNCFFPEFNVNYNFLIDNHFWKILSYETEKFVQKYTENEFFSHDFDFLEILVNFQNNNILNLISEDFGIPLMDWFISDDWVLKRFRKYGFRFFKTYRTFYKKDDRFYTIFGNYSMDFITRSFIQDLKTFILLDKPKEKGKIFTINEYSYRDHKLLIYKIFPIYLPSQKSVVTLSGDKVRKDFAYKWIFVTNKIKPLPIFLIYRNNEIRALKLKTYLLFLQSLTNSPKQSLGNLFWSFFFKDENFVKNYYFKFESSIISKDGKILSFKKLEKNKLFFFENAKSFQSFYRFQFFNLRNNNLNKKNIKNFLNFQSFDFLIFENFIDHNQQKKLNQFKYLSRFLTLNLETSHLNFYTPIQYEDYRADKFFKWLKFNKYRDIEEHYIQYNLLSKKNRLYTNVSSSKRKIYNIKEMEQRMYGHHLYTSLSPSRKRIRDFNLTPKVDLPFSLANPKKYYIPYLHQKWYYSNFFASYPVNVEFLKFYSFYGDDYDIIRLQTLKVLKQKIKFDCFQIQKVYEINNLLYKYNYDSLSLKKSVSFKTNGFSYSIFYFYLLNFKNLFFYLYRYFDIEINSLNAIIILPLIIFLQKIPYLGSLFIIFFKIIYAMVFFVFFFFKMIFIPFFFNFFQELYFDWLKFYNICKKIYFHPFWIFFLYFIWVICYFFLSRFFNISREHYNFKNLFGQFDWDETMLEFNLMRNKYDNLSFVKFMKPSHDLLLKNLKEFEQNDHSPTVTEIQKLSKLSFENEILRKRKIFWFVKRKKDDDLRLQNEYEYNELRKNNEFLYNYYTRPFAEDDYRMNNSQYISRSKFLYNNVPLYERMAPKAFYNSFDKDFWRHGLSTSEFGRYRWIYVATLFYCQFIFLLLVTSFVFFVIF